MVPPDVVGLAAGTPRKDEGCRIDAAGGACGHVSCSTVDVPRRKGWGARRNGCRRRRTSWTRTAIAARSPPATTWASRKRAVSARRDASRTATSRTKRSSDPERLREAGPDGPGLPQVHGLYEAPATLHLGNAKENGPMSKTLKKTKPVDTNEDPLTGAPGAHPVGVAMGATGGAAAGAAVGAVGGPVGVAVGAAVGGVAGGLAGKGAAEAINPSVEDEYWRENYKAR